MRQKMLLEAKGFTDVVVSITEDSCDVVLNVGEVTDAKRATGGGYCETQNKCFRGKCDHYANCSRRGGHGIISDFP